jgi:hypothetical protein
MLVIVTDFLNVSVAEKNSNDSTSFIFTLSHTLNFPVGFRNVKT